MERMKKLKELEAASTKQNSTKIFIETPYRNHQLLESILQHCHPNTKLCIGVNLTGKDEKITTQKISDWKKTTLSFHKMPAIFLLYSGN
jgi:16S rRNA (cytidine1402-2'-O)-methyltransferase